MSAISTFGHTNRFNQKNKPQNFRIDLMNMNPILKSNMLSNAAEFAHQDYSRQRYWYKWVNHSFYFYILFLSLQFGIFYLLLHTKGNYSAVDHWVNLRFNLILDYIVLNYMLCACVLFVLLLVCPCNVASGSVSWLPLRLPHSVLTM